MHAAAIIAKKRDGESLTVRGNRVHDQRLRQQRCARLSNIRLGDGHTLCGMDSQEIADLTDCMLHSGVSLA